MRKKEHPLAGIVEFGQQQSVEMVEAAMALMKAELKARVAHGVRGPGAIVSTKRGRPSHVPPVNEASRLSGE